MANTFADAHNIPEVVFQAIGLGSTCWESMEGTGVFDDQRAKAAGEDAVERIGEIIKGIKPLSEMMEEVDANNREHGWHDEARTFGDDIALLHSELSEALEAFRKWGTKAMVSRNVGNLEVIDYSEDDGGWDYTIMKPEGIASEFADVLVRLLDSCARYGIDLQAEYEKKMIYNRSRPYRHGNRAL